jgi:hypothetical protein
VPGVPVPVTFPENAQDPQHSYAIVHACPPDAVAGVAAKEGLPLPLPSANGPANVITQFSRGNWAGPTWNPGSGVDPAKANTDSSVQGIVKYDLAACGVFSDNTKPIGTYIVVIVSDDHATLIHVVYPQSSDSKYTTELHGASAVRFVVLEHKNAGVAVTASTPQQTMTTLSDQRERSTDSTTTTFEDTPPIVTLHVQAVANPITAQVGAFVQAVTGPLGGSGAKGTSGTQTSKKTTVQPGFHVEVSLPTTWDLLDKTAQWYAYVSDPVTLLPGASTIDEKEQIAVPASTPAGGASPPAKPATTSQHYTNTPPRHIDFTTVAGYLVGTLRGAQQMQVNSGVYASNPIGRTLAMAAVAYHPSGYDSTLPSMSWPERFAVVLGGVATPAPGVGFGIQIGALRGVGGNIDIVRMWVPTAVAGSSVGSTAPATGNQLPRRPTWGFALGGSYTFGK